MVQKYYYLYLVGNETNIILFIKQFMRVFTTRLM